MSCRGGNDDISKAEQAMNTKKRRKLEVAVISDVHLGTYGSQAYELNQYLLSIKPGILILNGDIIDFWQFSKRYWPKTHMKVVKSILNLAAKGSQVYYITGNHDETLRKFAGLHMGNFEIVNKLELELNGKKTWFFHGDVFDVVMHNNMWLARLGAMGYDALIVLNVFLNFLSRLIGRGKVSLSKRIKDNVKTAVKYIGDFENTAAKLAIQKGFEAIVCGHIHHPEIKEITVSRVGHIMYLNSGDWVENLTSLEYNHGVWEIYWHQRDETREKEDPENKESGEELMDMDNREIFEKMVKEFKQTK
jgi:UDP-2,3-diacylglucosamine pyrophosphatase LpxH